MSNKIDRALNPPVFQQPQSADQISTGPDVMPVDVLALIQSASVMGAGGRAEHVEHGSSRGPSPVRAGLRALEPVRGQIERSEQGSAWGRTQTLAMNEQNVELVRVVRDKSDALTLTIDVAQPPGAASISHAFAPVLVPLAVWATVIWGNGSTTAQRTFRVDAFQEIVVIASYASVRVALLDLTGAVVSGVLDPSVAAPAAQVVGMAAVGATAKPTSIASYTVLQNGVSGVLPMGTGGVASPGRLLSIEAHLAAPAGVDEFLQVFDATAVPAAGTTPDLEIPLGTTPSGAPPRQSFGPGKGFAQGVIWAVSTTSGIYTPSAAQATVSAQILGL